MGTKQSVLKKEIASLRLELRERSAKHQEELTKAKKEVRLLQTKLQELQDIIRQADDETDKLKVEARNQEERMKALMWELARQLRLNGTPILTSPRSSQATSPSTRIALKWRLNDDLMLRQSTVSPKKNAVSLKEVSLDSAASSNCHDSKEATNVTSPHRSPLIRLDSTSSLTKISQSDLENNCKLSSKSNSNELKREDQELILERTQDAEIFAWEYKSESDSDTN
ncbi:uncharacterized protein PHALS_13865 [Plasmopara halstedii]|uniref:Uncharacterized protein n=1 Tax=Plasmopara halstedii TaxID=4781 RepID=A0A0P1A4S0_PLAHL|nr:uncharacterized protein PHALS_13865 [Plasmopara halstedii]CEG35102.1 hypothetical protein PHALS_13865 [Plasmopara halstedii]|eukprot:XP_024571471.1 hypothetical protein PHALS_13865 [Plasmopara halstedii]